MCVHACGSKCMGIYPHQYRARICTRGQCSYLIGFASVVASHFPSDAEVTMVRLLPSLYATCNDIRNALHAPFAACPPTQKASW